jgi:hypothetical protein
LASSGLIVTLDFRISKIVNSVIKRATEVFKALFLFLCLMKMIGYKRSFVTLEMDQWRTLSFFYSIHPEVCAWLSVLVPTLFLYKCQILFGLFNACLLSIVMMLLCLNLMIKIKVAINPATIRKNNVLKTFFQVEIK